MAIYYRIVCDDELIGTSALEYRDAGMGTASGQFSPASGYEKIRHVFRLFSEAQQDHGPADSAKLANYYRLRDMLNLALETSEGERIPTAVIHIADFSDEVDEDAYEVEVHVTTPAFFDRELP